MSQIIEQPIPQGKYLYAVWNADYASDVLIENLGANCIGSRAAIGVASLPSNAPVEVVLTAKVV